MSQTHVFNHHQPPSPEQFEPVPAEQLPPTLAGHGQELWHDLAGMLYTAELEERGTNRSSPYAGHTATMAGRNMVHPTVTRIPISLPRSGSDGYSPDAITYITGSELVDTLNAYGAGEAIIADEDDAPKVDVLKLPERFQDAILVANMYEAVALSQDAEHKQAATERNSTVKVEDLSRLGTLHHSTKIEALPTILNEGLLSIRHDSDGKIAFKDRGNVNFAASEVSRTVGNAATDHEQNLKNLTYSWYGGGQAYIHIARPKGCYREGEEIVGAENAKLIAGGLPSTEISAITVRSNKGYHANLSNINRVRDMVSESGFFIPIFSNQGKQVYNRHDYDEDLIARAEGKYLTQDMREAQEQITRHTQEVESMSRQLADEARAAIAQGISVEDYRQQKLDKMDAFLKSGGTLM